MSLEEEIKVLEDKEEDYTFVGLKSMSPLEKAAFYIKSIPNIIGASLVFSTMVVAPILVGVDVALITATYDFGNLILDKAKYLLALAEFAAGAYVSYKLFPRAVIYSYRVLLSRHLRPPNWEEDIWFTGIGKSYKELLEEGLR